jgi:cell division protein FtsL
MMRFLTTLSVAAMLISAIALHMINYQTRQLEQDVRRAELKRDKFLEDIAILRADRAFLARPARIEAAARILGMRPADISQLPPRVDGNRISHLGGQ